jgi:hypothetical protein
MSWLSHYQIFFVFGKSRFQITIRTPTFLTEDFCHFLAFQSIFCDKSDGKVVPMLHKLSVIPWRCLGSGSIDPHIVKIGTTWKRVVSFRPLPFYSHGNSPLWQLDLRLVSPELVWALWTKVSCPCRESKPTSSALQPIDHHYTNWVITAPNLMTKP